MLTARQSAAWILETSVGDGARQHPGQPGFLYPAKCAGGLVSAHCRCDQRRIGEGVWVSEYLAEAATVEGLD